MSLRSTWIVVVVLGLGTLGCSAPLSPEELCDSAHVLAGARIEVSGYNGLTLLRHGAVACNPEESCCNPATFAQTIVCPDGPDIVLVPAEDFASSPTVLECEAPIDNAPLVDGETPSAACQPSPCFPIWRSAIGTLDAEETPHPVTGEPTRLLLVDSITGRTR